LGLSIVFLSVAALTASPGGVAWVDLHEADAREYRLVFEKRSQLCERPAMQFCPLPPSGPDPRADATEFFDGDGTIRAFSGLDNALGNNMVCVAGEIRLTFRSLFKESQSGLGADLLEFLSQSTVAMPHLIQCTAGVAGAVRVAGNFYDPQIDAKAIDGGMFPVLGNVHRDIQIPLAMPENQIRFPVGIRQQEPGSFTADKRHFFTTVNGPDANSRWYGFNHKDTGVVSDTSMPSKDSPGLPVQFVGVCNFGNEQTGDLGRNSESIAEGTVKHFLQWKSAKLFGLPRQFRESIGGGVRGFNGFAKTNRLLGIWQKFYLHRQFHRICGEDTPIAVLSDGVLAALVVGGGIATFGIILPTIENSFHILKGFSESIR
jgi:hypothetical protein